MPTLPYQDAYLAKFCTDDREVRAYEDVDALGVFSQTWRDKLATIRCYIIACLENQADAEDLFTAKLKSYRGEFDSLLAQAKAVTTDTETGLVGASFTVALERG